MTLESLNPKLLNPIDLAPSGGPSGAVYTEGVSVGK